jgi:thiol-disulfide isomerase/thioredoxin
MPAAAICAWQGRPQACTGNETLFLIIRQTRSVNMRSLLQAAALAVVLSGGGVALAHEAAPASAVEGRWDAALVRSTGTVIPFRLDISGAGASLKGTLYDGFTPYDSTTHGSFQDGKLSLEIEHYLTTISATLTDGKLTGTVITQNRGSSATYGFQATRHVETLAALAGVPSIAGSYVIPLDTPSSKGEKAFRLIVRQRGPEVAASILRVDGDTGSYSGSYQDGRWLLSHFDGSRPGVIEVTPKGGGILEVIQRVERPGVGAAEEGKGAVAQAAGVGKAYSEEETPDGRYATVLTAYTEAVAQAKGLAQPENYETHTAARNADETFVFNFPDESGRLVSNEDPRFKGKVVLAIVTGTWCPNCHDEAQYLVQLDRKYRDRGLAIVALDFEEPEQQGSLQREHAFVKQYGVKYTYLIAGAPAEMWEKVPQLNNLNTWPATIFIGRDGKVKAVHSGFASPASGEFNTQLKKEFTSRIERLLAEKTPAPSDRDAAVAPKSQSGG